VVAADILIEYFLDHKSCQLSTPFGRAKKLFIRLHNSSN
jgi:hypothetical protein